MPSIYYQVSNYSGAYSAKNTPGETAINCTKLDLIRCMITVGNPSFMSFHSIRKYGFVRAFIASIAEKASLVDVNLAPRSGDLVRHPIFDSYIPDKKRVVSYNLGMAFAKFYSEKVLKIRRLVHVEHLKKQNAIKFLPGTSKREPDLVGDSRGGDWHVFEAKGNSTSRFKLGPAIADGKEQAHRVATIDSKTPATRSVCATFIGEEQVFTRLEDPPEEDSKLSIDLKEFEFLRAYYSPFTTALQMAKERPRQQKINGEKFDIVSIEPNGARLQIGLARRITEALEDEDALEAIWGFRFDGLMDEGDTHYSIGPDGFLVLFEGV